VTGPGGRRASPVRRLPRSGWHVYLLRCRDGSLYAGATIDLARRVAAHGRGTGARYTRSRLPVELVWCARATDRGAALRREAALKRLTRAEKLRLVREGGRGGRRSGPAPGRAALP
jgi:putative endonuclease